MFSVFIKILSTFELFTERLLSYIFLNSSQGTFFLTCVLTVHKFGAPYMCALYVRFDLNDLESIQYDSAK